MALTRQQLIENIEALEAQGAPQEDIQEYVNSQSITQEQPVEPSGAQSLFRPRQLAGSIAGAAREEFGSATQAIREAQAREARGEQSKARTSFTTATQGAQAGLVTAFRGALSIASALLPDFVEKPLRKALGRNFEEIISSPAGQKAVETIQDISERIDTLDPKNQQLIKDIADGLLTAIDIASVGVGGKVAKRGLADVGARAGAKGERLVAGAEADVVLKAEAQLADLVIDTSTPTSRAATATRTKEGGFFTTRKVTPTRREVLMAEELIQTPGIKTNRSALFNLNATTAAIEKEAIALRASLKKNNFIFPKKELLARIGAQLDELKRISTDIIGDSEKLADRIFDKLKVFVNAEEATGLGGLTARQNFDRWVKTKRPKAFEKQDAFNTAVRSARDTVNDFLVEKATKTDIKRSLQRQSRLKSVEDVLKVKSSKESAVGFLRLLDRAAATLGIKNQLITILGTAFGIGTFGATTVFAPALAIGGVTVGTTVLLIKALKSPTSRKALGRALLAIEKALPKASASQKPIITELRDELKALLDRDISIGLSIEDVSKGRGAIPKELEIFKGMRIRPIEQSVKRFDETGSAIIAEGGGKRLVIKDEGNFVSIKMGTGGLVSTDTVLPTRIFATKKEAFDAIRKAIRNGGKKLTK